MSATLPVVNRQPDFIGQLLDEQQQLSAVEQFSQWHEQTDEVAAPAQEKYYRSLLPASPPDENQQFAFEVDLNACSGCKACVVACHTLNGLEEDESWRRVGTLVIGDESTPAAIQHVTTACHHCEDPGCLNGCPVKAYDKDPVTGIVRHLDDQCIGCKYCTMMCPYEVPQYSDRLGIVRKCDMCHQRLSVGEAPACVQSCPNEAIRITVVPREAAPESDALVPSAPPSSITLPTTRYVSEKPLDPSKTRPQDENLDPVAESHWPLALMLVATQISVGVLAVELIVALAATAMGQSIDPSITLAAAVAAFAIGNAGLGIAPLHLGQPLRMWRVFLGLKTSWLSREAVVLGKYMGALAAGIALVALPIFWDWIPESVQGFIPTEWIPSWAGRALLMIAIPVGAIGLYCSAMIYIATQRELWRAERTLPRFFGTMVVGGLIVTASIVGFAGMMTTAALLAAMTTVAVGLKLYQEASVYGERSSGGTGYDRRSRKLIDQHLTMARSARFYLGQLTLVLSAIASVFCFTGQLAGAITAAIACLTFIAGECLERLLYFQSVVYDRMPRTL